MLPAPNFKATSTLNAPLYRLRALPLLGATDYIQFLVSTTMQAQASSQLYPRPPPPLPTFEFTKRKRWADLLITELTEAIILILSTQCQILYCSAAVKELLGWRDEELIDAEFLDLVNGAWMCSAWS
jgi:PAS domain-containing protein